MGEDIAAALEAEFGFEASQFGGAISAAAVVSAIQRVRGVVAVDLEEFPWPERRARLAEWDPIRQELRAAELVILKAPRLREMEVAAP